jgi:hypothetical protein
MGGTILKGDVLVRAQHWLDEGNKRSDVAAQCDVKADTLRKAIKGGRLKKRSETWRHSTKCTSLNQIRPRYPWSRRRWCVRHRLYPGRRAYPRCFWWVGGWRFYQIRRRCWCAQRRCFMRIARTHQPRAVTWSRKILWHT